MSIIKVMLKTSMHNVWINILHTSYYQLGQTLSNKNMYVRVSEDSDVVPRNGVVDIIVVVLDVCRLLLVVNGEDTTIIPTGGPVVVVPPAGDFHPDSEEAVVHDLLLFSGG